MLEGIDISLVILLVFSVLLVLSFEFINGFHDTANAVATVIYTKSLKPQAAVILSGTLNFAGVFFGGIGVAIGIINLLPTDALLQDDVWLGTAMILALLLAAIIWNFGTWYLGIPSSSSHTLIGSILGIGIAYSGIDGVNWSKAGEVALSLIMAPIIGMGLAFVLMFLLKVSLKNKQLFEAPDGETPPPMWVRAILVLTCSGVSFSHGSNDGQKGVGLLMLVLIGILPMHFALNPDKSQQDYRAAFQDFDEKIQIIAQKYPSSTFESITEERKTLKSLLAKNKLEKVEIKTVRKSIIKLEKKFKAIYKKEPTLEKEAKTALRSFKEQTTDYAPYWVLIAIAASLGLGTMVGWKRIVVTIGEKIGKQHLTYAQGASAELVATATIGFSSFVYSLPVSTTHILSSGVAGTMIASNGLKNLQKSTIRNIALAWVLTLPVSIGLAMILFYVLKFLLVA
ncbi:MAG: inorganic phosphate transporter [Thermonemataceae bacterium]|nr:inorganic phosphate transporter [Thermonemataceae bacterium]